MTVIPYQESIPPPNPWREKLQSQGIPLEIPVIRMHPDFTTDAVKDEKTGLPIENDALRRKLATSLSDSIRNGLKWGICLVDADNLKMANLRHTRQFGDMVILYGATRVAQAVNNAQVSAETKIVIARQTSAADEELVCVLDASEEELERLKHHLIETESPMEIHEPEFIFSLSSSFISSDDPRIQGDLLETKQWLEENPNRIAFDFYQRVKDLADHDVTIVKTAKDLERLPIEQLLTVEGINTFVEVLCEEYGNRRITESSLRLILRLMSVEAVKTMLKSVRNREVYEAMLRDFRITEEQLLQNGDPENMVIVFQDLFGKPQE